MPLDAFRMLSGRLHYTHRCVYNIFLQFNIILKVDTKSFVVVVAVMLKADRTTAQAFFEMDARGCAVDE